jgi:hypothetical protein
MKKNYTIVFAFIAALIALCAFWGCSSSDDDDDSVPSSALGDKKITLAGGEARVYNNDNSEYKPASSKTVQAQSSQTGASYAALTLGSIDTDGKLTLKLPVFTQWEEIGGGADLAGLGLTAAPSDVKIVTVDDFLVDGKTLELQNKNSGKQGKINYIYANKDAHISGQIPIGGGTQDVNLILKKGWNSVIITFLSSSSNSTCVNGSPDDGFKWVLDN